MDCRLGESLQFFVEKYFFLYILELLPQVFAVVQVIVSIAVAAANDTYDFGYKSAAFAAIWSMFLVVGFTGLGATIVFGGKATELLVGFLIGVAAMLAELFFVLMVMFFIIGTNAANSNQSKRSDGISLIYCPHDTLSTTSQRRDLPTRPLLHSPC